MNRNTIGVVIVLIVIAGGWYVLRGTPVSTPSESVTNQMPVIDSVTPETIVETATTNVSIVYSDKGFSPQSVTIPLGTTVTFVNQTSENMLVSSAPHPTHQAYDGTTMSEHCASGYRGSAPFDQCASGNNFDFTFLKVGEWKYHNHASATDFGTIIVTGNAAAPSSL